MCQKKLMRVTDAPQMTAAPHEISTPALPRLARCGLDEFAPQPPHDRSDDQGQNREDQTDGHHRPDDRA